MVEPRFEYEAPHFFDFTDPNHEDDGDQPDAWFDMKASMHKDTATDDDPLAEIEESSGKVIDGQSSVSTSPCMTNGDEVKRECDDEPSPSKIKNAIVQHETVASESEVRVPEANEDIAEALSSDNNNYNECKSEVEFSNDSLDETRSAKEFTNATQESEMSSEVDTRSETDGNDVSSEPIRQSKPNIVTSWGNSDREKAKISTSQSTANNRKNDPSAVVTRAQKRNRSLDVASGIPKKKQKGIPAQKKSEDQKQKRPRSLTGNSEKKSGKTLTLPVTPQCLKRRKVNPPMIKLKTREEMELECIAKMRKQTHHHIKENEVSMKKAISSTSYHPVRTTVDPTKPEEFHFETDKRIKQHQMTTRADDAEKEFTKSLRQHPPSPSWKNRGATIPKPFNLSGSGQSKRKLSALDGDEKAADSYQSVAYQTYKFQNTTPPRFRTKKAGDEGNLPERKAAEKPVKVTLPATPNLLTSARARPVGEDVLSKEQQEEKELEEMKSHKFKANPFDRRIVECEGLLGVKTHKEQKHLTQVEPFSFESDERLEARKEKKVPDQEKPAPFKALPQPKFEKVFRPKLKHARTEPKPFSFEEKDKARFEKKESKIQEVYKEEEKLREFRAQPLPSDSPDVLPEISSKSCTSFKPFTLDTENRGAAKAEKWIQKVQIDMQEERKKTQFHANPNKVVHGAPFVPEKSQKALTEVSEFALNTNRRAKRREALDAWKKEREMVDEELRKESEEKRLQEEKEEISKLRKELVHKPQPIHKYKNVVIKPSNAELTRPQSPAWSDIKQRRLGNIR